MKPYLKWAGGKARQADTIRSKFRGRARLYVEPFLGAGAVFFARAAADEFDHAIIADVNPRLMACHRAVRDDVEGVIDQLRGLPEERDPEAYYEIRHNFNLVSVGDWYNNPYVETLAAAFIWLNRACFNGLYRENADGDFNVPIGKGRFTLPDPDHLRACSKLLQRAELLCCDFQLALEGAAIGEGVQVYADPPYAPVSSTASFTSYSKGGFDYLDQVALETTLHVLSMRGAQVVASNSDTETTRTLYVGWNLEVVKERRNINSKGTGRGPVGELLLSRIPATAAVEAA